MLAVGSNILPGVHVPWAIERMVSFFPFLVVGRFYRTCPVAIRTYRRFWNGAVLVESGLSVREVKKTLCEWEIESGRNRSHPNCSQRDRTLDIDILWSEGSGWIMPRALIEETPYLALPASGLLSLKSRQKGSPRPLDYRPACFVACDRLLGLRPVRVK